MNSENKKIAIGVMLFATWLLLIIFKVQGAEDIITGIKSALIGLGAYHLNDRVNKPQTLRDLLIPPPEPPPAPEVKPEAPAPVYANNKP